MTFNKMTERILLILTLLTILLVPSLYAQEANKIIVMPFDIYANQDKTAIRESLYQNLTEELKKEKSIQVIPADEFLKGSVKIDEAKAIGIGRSKGADFVITGTLTQFGDSLNIDARIIDLQKKSTAKTSVQGKGLASLGAIAALLKGEILNSAGLSQKIARVEIQGNKKIASEAILTKLKSRPGGTFSETDVSADIKTIFKMGLFLDVTAEATSSPQGKIIIFTVQEKGLVTDIVINGNKALSKDEIKEALTIKTR